MKLETEQVATDNCLEPACATTADQVNQTLHEWSTAESISHDGRWAVWLHLLNNMYQAIFSVNARQANFLIMYDYVKC